MNTDTTTMFNVAGSSAKSFTEGVKVRNQERNDALLKIQNPEPLHLISL